MNFTNQTPRVEESESFRALSDEEFARLSLHPESIENTSVTALDLSSEERPNPAIFDRWIAQQYEVNTESRAQEAVAIPVSPEVSQETIDREYCRQIDLVTAKVNEVRVWRLVREQNHGQSDYVLGA